MLSSDNMFQFSLCLQIKLLLLPIESYCCRGSRHASSSSWHCKWVARMMMLSFVGSCRNKSSDIISWLIPTCILCLMTLTCILLLVTLISSHGWSRYFWGYATIELTCILLLMTLISSHGWSRYFWGYATSEQQRWDQMTTDDRVVSKYSRSPKVLLGDTLWCVVIWPHLIAPLNMLNTVQGSAIALY